MLQIPEEQTFSEDNLGTHNPFVWTPSVKQLTLPPLFLDYLLGCPSACVSPVSPMTTVAINAPRFRFVMLTQKDAIDRMTVPYNFL